MIKRIDYKSILFNNVLIKFPKRMTNYITFENEKYIIALCIAEAEDTEISIIGNNIHCYDYEGNLKWTFQKGIVGMEKENEKTIILYDGEYVHFVDVETGIEDKSRIKFTK